MTLNVSGTKGLLRSKTVISDIATIIAGLAEAVRVAKTGGDPSLAITVIITGLAGIWGRITGTKQIKGLL